MRDQAGWQQCLDLLRNAAGGHKVALARQEQAVGLRFSQASPLFAESTRRLVQLRHILFDPMHMVLSGGVAVTQLCGLLEVCKGLGIEPSRLDAYAACWRAPSFLSEKGGAVLPPGWFADRWVPKENRPGPQSHKRFAPSPARAAIGCEPAGSRLAACSAKLGPLQPSSSGFRAFAAEMLACIPIVGSWLADMAPRLQALQPHADAWKLLSQVCDLLFHTHDAAEKAQALQASIDSWRAAFVNGP